eukprot:m.112473 g.112473  ORF g.112473 m.112473 type:complete len:558 (-) comp10783_c0_seq3:67-1740(-)
MDTERTGPSYATVTDTAVHDDHIRAWYTELQYHRLATSASVYGMCVVRPSSTDTQTDTGANTTRVDGENDSTTTTASSTTATPSPHTTPSTPRAAAVVALCNRGGDKGPKESGLLHLVPSPVSEGVVPSFEWVTLPHVGPTQHFVSVAGSVLPDGTAVLGLTSMASPTLTDSVDINTNTNTRSKTVKKGHSGTTTKGAKHTPAASSVAMLHLFAWADTSLTGMPFAHCHIPLAFVPFCLEWMRLASGRTGFVLSGAGRLHFVDPTDALPQPRGDATTTDCSDCTDSSTATLEAAHPFPDILNVGSCVTAMRAGTFGACHVTAVGYQDGFCQLVVRGGPGSEGTDDDEPCRQHASVHFDSPITSMEFLVLPAPAGARPRIQLIVGCALEAAVVYDDVIRRMLEAPILLPGSDQHDSVLCVRATTSNFDAAPEIVVATYGQRLLGYRLTVGGSGEARDHQTSTSTEDGWDDTEDTFEPARYRLQWQHRFAYPLYRMEQVDVTGDGISELVVLSMFGLHVLQQDFSELHRRVKRVIELAREVTALEEAAAAASGIDPPLL